MSYLQQILVIKFYCDRRWVKIFDLALPNGDHLPAKCFKRCSILLVSGFVARDFFRPIGGVGFGNAVAALASMSVPKASVNEYDSFMLRKYEIGLARQCFYIETIPIPQFEERFA